MIYDNVDSAEVDKFSESASRWWDLDSEYKPLHDINPLRLDYIEQHAGLRGKTVLDVGAGIGDNAHALARLGHPQDPCPGLAHRAFKLSADRVRVLGIIQLCVSDLQTLRH